MWIKPCVSQKTVAMTLLADRPTFTFFFPFQRRNSPFWLLIGFWCDVDDTCFVHSYEKVYLFFHNSNERRQTLLWNCHTIRFVESLRPPCGSNDLPLFLYPLGQLRTVYFILLFVVLPSQLAVQNVWSYSCLCDNNEIDCAGAHGFCQAHPRFELWFCVKT